MENQLAYFGGLLVRATSKEVLGWTTQDLQHALHWADYWERLAQRMAAVGDVTTRTTLRTAVDRMRLKYPTLRLSVEDLSRARFILLRSLVNNLLIGRSMPAVAAVATAHMLPSNQKSTDATTTQRSTESVTNLAQGVTARVSADAAATAVMRMALVASRPQLARGSNRHCELPLDDPEQPNSRSLREFNAESMFESYRTNPSCVVKLASARDLVLPTQQKRGQKRRASANDDSSGPIDTTAVARSERGYLQELHEHSDAVLADIRSAVENGTADGDTDLEKHQVHSRDRGAVCLEILCLMLLIPDNATLEWGFEEHDRDSCRWSERGGGVTTHSRDTDKESSPVNKAIVSIVLEAAAKSCESRSVWSLDSGLLAKLCESYFVIADAYLLNARKTTQLQDSYNVGMHRWSATKEANDTIPDVSSMNAATTALALRDCWHRLNLLAYGNGDLARFVTETVRRKGNQLGPQVVAR